MIHPTNQSGSRGVKNRAGARLTTLHAFAHPVPCLPRDYRKNLLSIKGHACVDYDP